MATELAKAYVQIIPSAEGISGKISNVLNDESEGAGKASGSKFTEGFKSVLGGIGKVTAGAVAAGTTAMAGLTKQAVSSFAEFEQLKGGAELLFGDAYGKVITDANHAFSEVQMSVNDYLTTANSYATGLKEALGGDEMAAANLTNKIITAQADIVAATGNSSEAVANAFAGIMKNNFSMLDNLQLGIKPTKEGMQEVIDKMNELNGTKYKMGNLADMQSAIVDYVKYVGMAEYAHNEASSTIEGALATAKAAWENLLTAISVGDMDTISTAIDNLVSSASQLSANLQPVIERSLTGISILISELAPQIAQALPNLIQQVLPGLLTAGVDIISTLGEGILNAIPELMPVITDVILQLCDMLIQMLPQLIDIGMQVILQLAMGIAQALPELIPALLETIWAIEEYLIDNVDLLIDAAIAIIMGLAEGIINALPKLIEKAPEIIMKLVEALIRNAPKIIQAGIELILMLVKGLVDSFGKLLEVGKKIVDNVKNGFDQKVQDAKNWGKDMIQNFIDGIMAKWNDLKASVSKVAQTVKDFIGFSEPKYGALSNFHTFAPDMMQLFAQGINDNIDLVTDAMHNVADDVMSTNIDMNAVQTVGGSIDVQNNSDSIIARIEALLAQYLPYINDNNIYLDTGVLVGATAGSMNTAIGVIGTRSNKR